jgi:hypothetical protein
LCLLKNARCASVNANIAQTQHACSVAKVGCIVINRNGKSVA